MYLVLLLVRKYFDKFKYFQCVESLARVLIALLNGHVASVDIFPFKKIVSNFLFESLFVVVVSIFLIEFHLIQKFKIIYYYVLFQINLILI
jgi:hypothetical protein